MSDPTIVAHYSSVMAQDPPFNQTIKTSQVSTKGLSELKKSSKAEPDTVVKDIKGSVGSKESIKHTSITAEQKRTEI